MVTKVGTHDYKLMVAFHNNMSAPTTTTNITAAEVASKLLANSDVTKEIAAIKAQLLVLVGRLDRLEQELGK